MDIASSEVNLQFTGRLREREQGLLSKIDAALEKIESGDYGECVKCGEEIGVARLRARPVAELCIDCKAEEEKLERRTGCASARGTGAERRTRRASRAVLGIESSCDEMAAAVVRGGREVLASVVQGQDELHQPYGGVVPELASRDHVRSVSAVVGAALARGGRRRGGALAASR